MNRFLILISLLAAALACYSIGFAKGALIFIGIGILLELGFWIGFFGTVTSNNESVEVSPSDDK